MRKIIWLLLMALPLMAAAKKAKKAQTETWPDGTPMDAWFMNTEKVDVATLGRQYVITDYGVVPGSKLVQTE